MEIPRTTVDKTISRETCFELCNGAQSVKSLGVKHDTERQVLFLSVGIAQGENLSLDGQKEGVCNFAMTYEGAAILRDKLREAVSEFLEPYLEK